MSGGNKHPRRSLGRAFITIALSLLASNAMATWRYSQDTDAMRGTTRYVASVTSDNTVALSWPTGDVVPVLTLRTSDPKVLEAYVTAPNAQLVCHEGIVIAVRVDQRPVEEFECLRAESGASDLVFIKDGMRFMALLQRASTVTIEAPFYQDGRQQFSFSISGLAWTLNN